MTPTQTPDSRHDRIELSVAGLLTLGASAVQFDGLEAAAPNGGPAPRPRFEIVGYTGAPVNAGGFYTPVILDMAGMRVAAQEIPVLRDHDHSRIVGQTDSVRVGADLRMSGIVTGDNADAVEVRSQAKNGFKWQASIGASIVRREFLDAGKTATVNGRQVSGPILIARETLVKEVSFVALGADGATSASVAASSPSLNPAPCPQGIQHMNFDAWLKAQGFDPATLSDGQINTLRLAYNAQAQPQGQTGQTPAGGTQTPASGTQTQTQSPSLTLDAVLAERRAENARVERITQLTAAAIAERPMMLDEIERISRAAIDARSTVAEFELHLLRLRADAPAVHVRNPLDLRAAGNVIEAAICLSGRLTDVEKRFDERTLQTAHERYRGRLGLKDLLMMAARENGYTGHVFDVRQVLTHAFMDVRLGGFSSYSLAGILGNTANKFLIAAFNGVEAGWRDVASIRNVTDFKTVTSYSLTGDMQYEKLGPGGEIKHATVGERSYTNRADTYGRLFAITRQDIINDDLGALTQVPARLGRGAALKLNDVFWTTFLAGVGSFWTSGQGNLISGATTVLSAAGLEQANTKFRRQTDPDGKPLGLAPRILLVPPEVETTAAALMTSMLVNTGGSSTTDRVPNANVWQGKYRIVSASYLSNASYTGYSTTAWFLLADPLDMSTIEVALLNGQDTPTVESAAADFDTLGIQMRGYHDFGVATQEYRASVRSAGA